MTGTNRLLKLASILRIYKKHVNHIFLRRKCDHLIKSPEGFCFMVIFFYGISILQLNWGAKTVEIYYAAVDQSREIICWLLTVHFIFYLFAQAGVFSKSGNRIRISNGMPLSLMCTQLRPNCIC